MKKIKNIIFDLGGVLFGISAKETLSRFKSLGIQDVDKIYLRLLESDIFRLFEIGKISEEEFRSGFARISGHDLSTQQFCECWNAMITSYPERNKALLDGLKDRGYNLYVLSNTNETHVRYLEPMAGWRRGLFSKIYYSNEIHLRKPDLECYKWVIEDSGIDPQETLFVDDRLENILAAQESGLIAERLDCMENLSVLLDKYLK